VRAHKKLVGGFHAVEAGLYTGSGPVELGLEAALDDGGVCQLAVGSFSRKHEKRGDKIEVETAHPRAAKCDG
jgi:hypothetical protein